MTPLQRRRFDREISRLRQAQTRKLMALVELQLAMIRRHQPLAAPMR
jgi:hypothetical protein